MNFSDTDKSGWTPMKSLSVFMGYRSVPMAFSSIRHEATNHGHGQERMMPIKRLVRAHPR
jgi:hypothetical protein